MAIKILSDAEIAAAAKAAGFTGQSVAIITAIALAESSGNMYAHNPKPPDNSYGLTQVNMLGSMGPERRKQFGLTSNEQLYDPVTNMKAAYAISSRGTSWTPWSTYIYGSYRLYMPRAGKASGQSVSDIPTAGNGTASQVGLSEGVDKLSEFADFLGQWQTWARAGMILGGAILVIVALSAISGTTGKVIAAADKVANVVPPARAVKAVATVAKKG